MFDIQKGSKAVSDLNLDTCINLDTCMNYTGKFNLYI